MKADYTKKLSYKIAVILFGSFCVFYLFVFNTPKDRRDNVYEKRVSDKFGHVHLKEKSDELGVKYRHNSFYSSKDNKSDLSVEFPPPSVSVVDVNNDGFMDIFITTTRGLPNLLYINHGGQTFSEEAKSYGLDNLNDVFIPSYALWGDFNNDGLTDLAFIRYGCHTFFSGTKDGKFIENQKWFNGYCSRPNGVNTADFYNRGKLDIVFSNFLPQVNEKNANPIWMTNTRYDNSTGGSNHLLRNEPFGFVLETKADFKTRSYSHNAGIADINLDGLPDIFFSNDYAHDEMFLNNGNGTFKDVTDEYIPRVLHGLSGMNTEFFDYDSDGLIDLYVTNIYKPPFNRHFNLLWKKTPTNTFVNVSNNVGVAKCGFSWAAKFSDLDNDGEADLMVVNGRSRSPDIKKFGEGKSMWFERSEVSQIPTFLKKYYRPDHYKEKRYISAFERKCLFMQKNGEFFDVAEKAGFADVEENRSLALIDYDNDGRMDSITAGPLSKLKIYHNETEVDKNNHWVGLSFISKNGSTINHGLKMEFRLTNGKKIVREIYPANGYRGFNDPRIHIGLGNAKIEGDITVYWPMSKERTKVSKIQLDQYNVIKE